MRDGVPLEARTAAVQHGVRRAIREHAVLGFPVCVWRDEQVAWLSPAETLEELGRTSPYSESQPARGEQ